MLKPPRATNSTNSPTRGGLKIHTIDAGRHGQHAPVAGRGDEGDAIHPREPGPPNNVP